MRGSDDMLRRALRHLEASAPVAEPPDLRAPTGRGRLVATVALTGSAAVLAGVALASFITDDRGVGESSTTPSPITSPAETAVAAPSVDETASPTTAGPTATPVPTNVAASFTDLLTVDAGGISFVNAIQPLPDGRFIAAVNAIDSEQVPPIGPTEFHGSIYIGESDGAWQLLETGNVLEQVRITHLFAPPGDQLVIYGYRLSPPGPGQQAVTDGPVAFTSADGSSWTEADIAPVDGEIAHGRLGYVMARFVTGEPVNVVEIYRSDNARDWELAYRTPEEDNYWLDDVGAGDEGFVVTARRGVGEESRPITLASGDGVTWLESPEQPALAGTLSLYEVASHRGDWVAAGVEDPDADPGVGVPIFWSANGLNWQEVARIGDPAGREEVKTPSHLTAVEGRLFLSLAYQAEGVESRPAGVWTSEDGRLWRMLDLGDESEVRAVLATGETILMGGRIGNEGGDAVIWSANDSWFER